MNSRRHFSVILLFFLSGAAGCAREGRNPIRPGLTTESELLQLKGQPTSAAVSQLRSEAKILRYESGEFFQVEKGKVVVSTRPPRAEETTLQSWRHRWKGRETRYEKVAGTKNHHGQGRFQLTAPSLGTAVLYDPASDRVTEVIEYGTQR